MEVKHVIFIIAIIIIDYHLSKEHSRLSCTYKNTKRTVGTHVGR